MQNEMTFLARLIDGGVIHPVGVDGVYARGFAFEGVLAGIDRLLDDAGRDLGAEIIRLPPVMPRRVLERSGYLNGFPHFAGTVHCFCGDDAAHGQLLSCLSAGEDWTGSQQASDLVLTPAACYPIYPLLAQRGTLAEQGALVDVLSYCFRREPSLESTRLQSFRMREFIRVGTPAQVVTFRDEWIERGSALIEALDLPTSVDVANDPFFGRRGRLMSSSQREKALKFELLIPIDNAEKPTACMSFNYHEEHFAEIWDMRVTDGSLAHTACVGFGLERLTLALFRHHGLDPAAWPEHVRAKLGLGAG
jgi:seryl-tRNA synthetase